MPFVLTAENITKDDVRVVGGKAANLAELMNAKFPVPEAFFISVESYDKFLEANTLKAKIKDILDDINYSDVNSLNKGTQEIRDLILNGKIPLSIKDEIIKHYRNMAYGKTAQLAGIAFEFIKAGRDLPFVAVRSSAITEDITKASSAGQYETFLNVRGEENLVFTVKKCWASLYTPRATYYRHKHGQPQETSIGVIIQKMVNSDRSGVAFTIDPTRPVEGANKIIIEATWGLGEIIVQGAVEPDRYIVDKTTGDILDKKIGKKTIHMIRDAYTGTNSKEPVPSDLIEAQVLQDNEIRVVAAYCKKIEQHYNYPQDIEWAAEKGKIFITQTRAVTTLEKTKEHEAIAGTPILEGLGSSPGVASGAVKIIHNIKQLDKIEKGDILVTRMTSPDMVVAMEKSAAIVTDEGGATCHASIVSRELGIPCVVGTKTATQTLKDGMEITVDATNGKVFSGEVAISKKPEILEPLEITTGTKIKVNLAFPETAEKAKHADGVGLMRLEHLLTKAGMHPVEYIRQGKQEELIEILIDGIGIVARAFYPKPVWVRSLDARTDEFRNMKGGESEPHEANPMLGWHGIRRSIEQTDILKSELIALKKLSEQGLDNIEIMLPFVIDVSELKKAKEIVKQIGAETKFGIMIETPAAALTIEDFCKEGVSFISFGSNDLTQLTLGIDRNNEKLIKMFDEMHPAMMRLFKDVIWTCKKNEVRTSICGELPSNSEEAVEFLVQCGIDSVSVNIDAIDKVRGWVARIEKKLLLDKTK